MPLSGNFEGLRKLERSVAGLAQPGGSGQKVLLSGVRSAVRGLLKQEFASGAGPDGEWEKTRRGRAALVSRKLPQTFFATLEAGAVKFVSRTKRDWLQAHQLGHTFKSRQVAAEKQFLTFNKKGRLIKANRALNKKGDVRRGVHQTFARAHTVGQRVLPQREIYPMDGLTPRWEAAIAKGVTAAMQKWAEKASE